MAHTIGLGRNAGQVVEEAPEKVVAPAEKPVRRVRKSVVEAKQAAQEHLGGGGEGATAVPDDAGTA